MICFFLYKYIYYFEKKNERYLDLTIYIFFQYDKIWIESPSRSRLAQWLNHDNSDRLIHLEFQLAEEPEEGEYRIHVEQVLRNSF